MTDIALFDLDNTLLDGDSDYEWGQFLCDTGLVDATRFEERNKHFYQQYTDGKLDITAYLEFALKPLTMHSNEKLLVAREDFINQKIKRMIAPNAKNLVAKHRQVGDITVIITATNRFVTEPIAALFEVDDLIATEVEIKQGRFTGKSEGTPCFKEGKLKRFAQWLSQTEPDYRKTWFYSDSINDLALLEYVDYPIIRNGDEQITRIAEGRNWQIIS